MTHNPSDSGSKDFRTSDFQRLCWNVFIYQKRYDYRELAAAINKKPDTVLAYFEGELRLHIDTVPKILAFVATKNPEDTELVDFFNHAANRISVRESEMKTPLNGTRQTKLIRLSILTGKIQGKIEEAYADNRLDKAEWKSIHALIHQKKELLAELEGKIEGDVR